MRLEIKNGSQRYDKDRTKSRHGHKYTKSKMSNHDDGYVQ